MCVGGVSSFLLLSQPVFYSDFYLEDPKKNLTQTNNHVLIGEISFRILMKLSIWETDSSSED